MWPESVLAFYNVVVGITQARHGQVMAQVENADDVAGAGDEWVLSIGRMGVRMGGFVVRASPDGWQSCKIGCMLY